jgi:pyridoxamine 5'-phosphate oxidase|tara:strand:+ start:34 stop:621 length:588 start_codon:yes stop_codon:yes gene_type:complete
MDPIERIQSDRAQARRLDDPNADLCFLALADSSGHASVRTLVLRDISEQGITLFINRTSPKWHIIDQGGDAELLIWYPSVQRQYRIRGTLTEIDAKTIATNWQRRPVGSKYLDHVYEEMGAQSSFIDSRESLTSKLADLKSSTSSDDLSVPPSATGVSLNYSSIDMLDLNKEDRIHDRQLFTLTGNSWQSKVMIP